MHTTSESVPQRLLAHQPQLTGWLAACLLTPPGGSHMCAVSLYIFSYTRLARHSLRSFLLSSFVAMRSMAPGHRRGSMAQVGGGSGSEW